MLNFYDMKISIIYHLTLLWSVKNAPVSHTTYY